MFRCPFSIVSEKILSIQTILTNFRLKLHSTQIDKSVVSLDLVGVSCGLKISSLQRTLWKSPINWNRLQTPTIGNDWTDPRIYGCRLYADDKRGLSRWEKGPWLVLAGTMVAVSGQIYVNQCHCARPDKWTAPQPITAPRGKLGGQGFYLFAFCNKLLFITIMSFLSTLQLTVRYIDFFLMFHTHIYPHLLLHAWRK